MGILGWIVFGFLAGAIARWLAGSGMEPQGCLMTIVLGILGSVVGGFIGVNLGLGSVNRFDLGSMGLAVLGSIVILVVHRELSRRR